MAVTPLNVPPETHFDQQVLKEKINEVISLQATLEQRLDNLNIVTTGFIDYADTATENSPISLPADTPTKLTNDGLGAFSVYDQKPVGVTDVWNPVTNQFDFSELNIGTWVEMRWTFKLTTTLNDTSGTSLIRLGIGSASQYDLVFSRGNYFFQVTDELVTRYNGFYIGSADIRDYPAEFLAETDNASSIKMVGFALNITQRLIPAV